MYSAVNVSRYNLQLFSIWWKYQAISVVIAVAFVAIKAVRGSCDRPVKHFLAGLMPRRTHPSTHTHTVPDMHMDKAKTIKNLIINLKCICGCCAYLAKHCLGVNTYFTHTHTIHTCTHTCTHTHTLGRLANVARRANLAQFTR